MTMLRKGIISVFLVSLWACGSPEQATVDQFFRAAQTNDSTTLAYMSAIGPPVEVESWKVVEVTSRTTEPYTLPELIGRFEAAKKARDASQEERKKYFEENEDALNQIIPKLREDPEYRYKGKIGEVQEAWLKLMDDRKEKESAYQELKREVDRETGITSKSVMRQLDVGTLKGGVAVTDMLLNLKAKDGAELPFRVQLRKFDLSEAGSDRVEPARWVIVDIEGTTPEAKAAAAAHAKARAPVAEAGPASEQAPAAAEAPPAAAAAKVADVPKSDVQPAHESSYVPKELRGLAKVQILTPETKVEGDQVVSIIRVRNASKDWITGFMVTEHWYDKQGNAVGTSSRTHRERFMPGDVIELELKTKKSPDFYQNQYLFKHANGEVTTTTVAGFPKRT
jgi:hypothetical protein